jgi:DNA (cytosine-5)-methyltransferase 1
VLADLESEGYAGRAIVVPACAVNAPHRRDRVWIIARSLAHTEQQRLQGHVEQQTESSDAPSGCSTDTTVADTDSSGMEGSRSEQQTARSSRAGEDVAHSEVERTQGLRSSGVEESPAYAGQEVPLCRHERIGSSYWETEPAVGRVADGIPNRVDRLKGLGNAIVPQVAYELIRHLETDG